MNWSGGVPDATGSAGTRKLYYRSRKIEEPMARIADWTLHRCAGP